MVLRPRPEPRHARRAGRAGSLVLAVLLAMSAGCGPTAEEPTTAPVESPTAVGALATPTLADPMVVLAPTAVPEPTTPTPTPTPAPEPTRAPAAARVFSQVEAQVVTPTVSRAAPSMSAGAVRELPALSQITLVAEEHGENWIIGDQDWVPLWHEWESTWYRLADGSYVHRAFVFLPDGAPLPANAGAERYVIVDLERQTAWAMEGATIVREMPVTTGKRGFETPSGEFRVLGGGRILNERMTSQRAGFDDPNDRYDVERVLYTQYFGEGGFALHLNYWQPTGVFGNVETSHGCVGMLLADAQFLWMFAQEGMRVVVRNSGGPQPLPAAPPPSTAPTVPSPEAVKIFAVQDGRPGATAVVAARTVPGTTCALTLAAPTGASWAQPAVGSQVADAGGWLEWTWTIEPGASPGRGVVTVSCPGGNASADFAVR